MPTKNPSDKEKKVEEPKSPETTVLSESEKIPSLDEFEAEKAEKQKTNEEETVSVEDESLAAEKPEEEKSILDKIEDKKDEVKAIGKASQSLAEENNLPSEKDDNVISKGERILAAIGYLSFLCILPLVLKPKSEFCQMHGKQGLILIVLWLILTPIRFIGDMVFNSSVITGLFGLCYVGFVFWGIFTVAKGKMGIPILSQIAKKLNW